MSESKSIKMRVNVAGYSGQPVSLIAAFDPETDVLLVAKELPYEGGARDGFLRITTSERDPAFDALFDEENMRDAIGVFFELDAMGLISLTDATRRHDPKNQIERDGMDEKGVKYRIAPTITSGQVAVLIAAFYAGRQRHVAASASIMSDLLLYEL